MIREQELVYDSSYLLYGGGATFVLSILTFKLIVPVISRCFIPSYNRLTKYEQAEWNDRFISNINSFIAIGLSSYSLMFERGMRQDMVWYDSFWARLACGIVVGYMLADFMCMSLWCKVSRGEMFGYVFHHAATVYAYYFISAYGVLCYFGMLRLIAEMSTPAVNQRWYFDVLDYPRSNVIVIINGLLMVLTFFVFRMVILPIYWYHIWTVAGTEAVNNIGHIQLIMYIPTSVLDVLNIYWFYKMCRGFVKAVKKIRDKTPDLKLKTV